MQDKQEQKFDKRAEALRNNLKRRKDLAKEKKSEAKKELQNNEEQKE